jgi:hypothetical protein
MAGKSLPVKSAGDGQLLLRWAFIVSAVCLVGMGWTASEIVSLGAPATAKQFSLLARLGGFMVGVAATLPFGFPLLGATRTGPPALRGLAPGAYFGGIGLALSGFLLALFTTIGLSPLALGMDIALIAIGLLLMILALL